MKTSDISRIALGDFLAALGLLTRLPLPRTGLDRRGATAAWAWPLAGLVVGVIAVIVASMALWAGFTPGTAAVLAIATQAVVTGAMHEDGLADCVDGFWGGWDKARRLEIMKDSHIGSYGVLALVLISLLRWSALASLLATAGGCGALVAASALSRAPMAAVMAWLPNARGTGLSHSVGQPSTDRAVAATAIALVLAILLLGGTALAAAAAAGFAAVAVGFVARAKIGGQTGDVLGATQQLAEAAVLCTCAACLT